MLADDVAVARWKHDENSSIFTQGTVQWTVSSSCTSFIRVLILLSIIVCRDDVLIRVWFEIIIIIIDHDNDSLFVFFVYAWNLYKFFFRKSYSRHTQLIIGLSVKYYCCITWKKLLEKLEEESFMFDTHEFDTHIHMWRLKNFRSR